MGRDVDQDLYFVRGIRQQFRQTNGFRLLPEQEQKLKRCIRILIRPAGKATL